MGLLLLILVPGARVWRATPLGLSLIWLCSIRHWLGAAGSAHCAAPPRPTLRGHPRASSILLALSCPWCSVRIELGAGSMKGNI
jgi:hypothetical protein